MQPAWTKLLALSENMGEYNLTTTTFYLNKILGQTRHPVNIKTVK